MGLIYSTSTHISYVSHTHPFRNSPASTTSHTPPSLVACKPVTMYRDQKWDIHPPRKIPLDDSHDTFGIHSVRHTTAFATKSDISIDLIGFKHDKNNALETVQHSAPQLPHLVG
ncbi:hypothetical protein NX059_000931 [Plenodomus lindquistii]|nr:hypothetical protein NX059_000931 [Plenodomus lindquistii]